MILVRKEFSLADMQRILIPSTDQIYAGVHENYVFV